MPRGKKRKVTSKTPTTRRQSAARKFNAVKSRRFKWAESYTSLLMGIVVVVVGVLLGVAIFRQVHKPLQQTSSIQLTPTLQASNQATVTPTPTKQGEKTYVVQKGDDLWAISEKFYKSGYNWVDIASANNISDPSTIFSGDKLIIPSVAPKQITVQVTTTPTPVANAIKGNTYTVQKDDTLWDIAVRAYADGYKWTEIAKANNLSDPSLIFSGNVLQIPR